MALNTAPIFSGAPVVGHARISTANTNRDGTGTVATLVTAGSDGTRVDRVNVCATVTTTAGMVRLFQYDGTNYRLVKEIPVTAVTVGASTPGFTTEWVRVDGLPVADLPSGSSLVVSTHNAEQFDVVAYGGSYSA